MKQIKGGLEKTTKDGRDFKLGQIWPAIPIEEVPKTDFRIAEPLEIKDQGDTDMCAAFASCAVSEAQEGVILDPLYFFAKVKQIQGNWQEWGADLRSACKAAVKFGFIEKKDSPFTLEKGRDFVANKENWPIELDQKALEHRKASYFRVDGYKDMFDSIRARMWQFREEERLILTGCKWANEWVNATKGVLPQNGFHFFLPHAFVFIGQKIIDGELRLEAQLSNGKEMGREGLFYFSREQANKVAPYGAFMLKDISPDDAKKVCWPIWRRILEALKNWLNEILK